MKQTDDFYIHALQNMRDKIAKRKKPSNSIADNQIPALENDDINECEIQLDALTLAIEALSDPEYLYGNLLTDISVLTHTIATAVHECCEKDKSEHSLTGDVRRKKLLLSSRLRLIEVRNLILQCLENSE